MTGLSTAPRQMSRVTAQSSRVTRTNVSRRRGPAVPSAEVRQGAKFEHDDVFHDFIYQNKITADWVTTVIIGPSARMASLTTPVIVNQASR